MRRIAGSALHAAGLAWTVACAGSPPVRPHDMSTTRHGAAARQQEEVAQEHQRLYDPAAAERRTRCISTAGSTDVEGGCWTSVRNPTDQHRIDAELHRRQAADHRAASAVLRAAEARACAGVAPGDRDASPFTHVEDIESVKPLEGKGSESNSSIELPRGAIVRFGVVPGLTAGKLQTIVACHLARNAALGHIVPEMPDCPLVPAGAQTRVRTTGVSFEVEVWASDPDTALEVLARARRLVGPSPPAANGGARPPAR